MADPSGEDEEAATRARRRRRRGSVRLSLDTQVFVKKGLRPFDMHDPYSFAVSLSWKKFAALFLAAEFAINTLFACLYSLQPGSVSNQRGPPLVANFFFSLETLATVGYGEMFPATTWGHVVSSCEILVGVIFTAIVTGLLFVRFSRPKAKVRYATHPVVTSHNGKPTLMLRIGNARNTLLHDARFQLHALFRSVSEEGLRHASLVDLPLVRGRVPIFSVLLTMMHVIDENSPLHGLDARSPELAELRFFMSTIARDPAVAQEVADVHTFKGDDILWGMRYVDAIRTEGREVIADYALLSDVVPAGERTAAGPADRLVGAN